ncbi:MAG: hypothetical protein ABI333_04655, partial [bacterium]
MGKWDKVADDLEEEEALTKAPEFQDMVVDVVDPQDATMPPEFRGCQVIERRYPGGHAEIFYCRPDGVTYAEDQANLAIGAYRSGSVPGAGVVPGGGVVPGAVVAAPTRDSLIDTLGVSLDIPPKLRGARLVDRGGSFLFITLEGEEIPKEVGDGLYEAWESPEVTNPRMRLPESELIDPVPVPMPGATKPAETIIDTLGAGNDVPPRLRGAQLVERHGSFFFVTPDGDAIPKEIGDALFEAWDAPEEQKEEESGDSSADPLDAAPGEPAAPEPDASSQEALVDELGSGDDIPPQLRGARLLESAGAFVYETPDGGRIPAEIGEELLHAWQTEHPEADPEAPIDGAPQAAPAAFGEPQDHATEAEAAPPGEPAQPLRRPFGYDDFGPVTVPDAQVPETIDVHGRAAIQAMAVAQYMGSERAPEPEPPAAEQAPPAAQPEPPAAQPEPPAAESEPPAAQPEPPAAQPEPPA